MQEVGLGIRLNPFHCSDEDLLAVVDKLVNDNKLSERMDIIGQRVRKANDKKVISDMIEKIIQ